MCVLSQVLNPRWWVEFRMIVVMYIVIHYMYLMFWHVRSTIQIWVYWSSVLVDMVDAYESKVKSLFATWHACMLLLHVNDRLGKHDVI